MAGGDRFYHCAQPELHLNYSVLRPNTQKSLQYDDFPGRELFLRQLRFEMLRNIVSRKNEGKLEERNF